MCHMSGQLKDSIVKCMVWVCVRCGGKGGRQRLEQLVLCKWQGGFRRITESLEDFNPSQLF